MREEHFDLEQVFEAVIPLCIIGSDLSLKRVNKGFLDLFGADAVGVPGLDCRKLWLHILCESSDCLVQRALECDSTQVRDVEFMLPSCGRMAVQVSARRVSDVSGQSTGVALVFREQGAGEALRSELLQARQLLRSVLDTIPVRVFWKDLDLNFLGCNKSFAQDAGLSNPDEIIGKNDHQMGWRDQAELYRRDDLQVIKSGAQKIGYEEPQTTPAGDTIWLRTSKAPLRSSEGSVIGVLGTYEEITQRKKAEESLRASEAKLKAIYSSAPVGIGIVRDRMILEANQAFCDMLGRSFDELAGSPARILYTSEEDYEFVGIEKHRQIGETGICSLEVPMARKDGKSISVIVGVTLLDSSDPSKGEVFTVLDITERKEAEKKLRLQATVLDQISDRVTVTDLSGRITYANQAEVESLGYSREELQSMTIHDFGEDPSRGATQADILRNTLERGRWHGTVVNRKRSGEEILFDVRTQIIFDQDRKPMSLCGISTDITEKVREDERKRDMQLQLLHAQKLESIGRLAGGVAHDFNNMLEVILGHADIVDRKLSHRSPLRENISEIRTAAERSAELTRQLLGFARRQTAEPRVLDLNATLSGMLSMLRRLIGENIHLDWSPGGALRRVRIDPNQLNQVLANLVVNARDAMSGNGILLIRTANADFDREFCSSNPGYTPGGFVMLEVSDSGCGMDDNVFDHLFEPFFTTKEVGQGTGLGLATVFGIVSQNGGFIKVSSEPGRGSVFRIYLPEVTEPVSPADRKEGGKPVGGTETILFVEDEEMILNMASEVLRSSGYIVLTARLPEEAAAVSAGHAGDIHLLITDMMMPGMNGRELSETLSKARPDMKTLYISGYTADTIAHQGVLNEGVNFLQKPFSVGLLLEKVRRILTDR